MTRTSLFTLSRVFAFTLLVVLAACSRAQESETAWAPTPPAGTNAALPADHPAIPASDARPATGHPGARKKLQVSVRLSPELRAKVGANDALYVFARAAHGPAIPLAIVRKQAKDLPLNITLDDSMAMVPEMALSAAEEIVVGARISKSGDAIAKPGDLEGFSPPIKGSAAEVVIGTVVSTTPKATAMPAAEPAPHAPAQFDHGGGTHKTRLNIPAEVQAKWKSVELSLSGTDIAGGTHKIAIGGERDLGNGTALRVVAFVPAFQSDAGTVTSSSNKPENPAVLVQLMNNKQLHAEGWVFQKLPDFNTFKSDRVQVKLLGAQDH